MNRPNKGVGNTDGVARVKLAKRESVTTDRVQQKTGVEICGVGEAAVRSNLVAGKVSIWLQHAAFYAGSRPRARGVHPKRQFLFAPGLCARGLPARSCTGAGLRGRARGHWAAHLPSTRASQPQNLRQRQPHSCTWARLVRPMFPAALGHAAQHCKGSGMGLEQHLMSLAVKGAKYESPAGR